MLRMPRIGVMLNQDQSLTTVEPPWAMRAWRMDAARKGAEMSSAMAVAGAPKASHAPGLAPAGEDVGSLFARWQGDGDQAARDELVRRFMPLTRGLARRYGNSSEPFEDLVQVASLGLLKAIDRYDAERGYPFPSFAVPTILGEMRRYFRDSGWAVHVPRGAQERALKVRDAQERLANAKGHSPTVNQLAEYLEFDTEEVIDALQAIHAYQTVSLDAPRPSADDQDAVPYGESIGTDDKRYELIELDATLSSVLARIPARERAIMRMRFVDDLTQTEIAERVGVSQMQVSRLLRRSLEQLRALTHTGEDVVVRRPGPVAS
jgi:RNA polymerase sigma-B factor